MHILYLVGRELGYTRNSVLLRAFSRLGTVQVIGETQSGSLLLRTMRVFLRALPYLLTQQYDLIFVGFYGHLLMLPVGILSRSPVLFDAFVSTYDTLCFDRRLFAPRSLPGRFTFWLDQTACRLADLTLLDTQLHADYFIRTFALSPDKVQCLPVGCNEKIFFPKPQIQHDNITHILYYSTYLPLHGVETVVRAAELLRNKPELHFKLIGIGQDYARIRRMADELGLNNITFVPSVPLETLADEIASADICLGGHFGHSDKAGRVVPGKLYQIIAMRKPLIASDTPANRALLTAGENALLCPAGDSKALADAIQMLVRKPDLRSKIAHGGRVLFEKECSEAVITQRLQEICNYKSPLIARSKRSTA